MDEQQKKENEPLGFRRLILFGLMSLLAGVILNDLAGDWAGLCATAGVMGFLMEMHYVG